MTSNLVYAVGTLVSWAGWFFAIRFLLDFAALVLGEKQKGRSAFTFAAAAGALLSVGTALTANLPTGSGSTPSGEGFRIPLFWPVMPAVAWLAVVGAVVTIYNVARFWLSAEDIERSKHLKAATASFAAAAIGFVLFKPLGNIWAPLEDKSTSSEVNPPVGSITFLTGGVALSLQSLVTILLLAVVGVLAMTWVGRTAKARGLAKGLATQAALIAGAVLFGLPLAYLIVTSFKEDRDMTNRGGIVWIPKVQHTVPYYDPTKPLYEAIYEGRKVTGRVIAERPGDTVQIDIDSPFAIRGTTFETARSSLKEIPRDVPVVEVEWEGRAAVGRVIEDLEDGSKRVEITSPPELTGKQKVYNISDVVPVRRTGLRWQNYPEAISYLPTEARGGLVYLRNTLVIVVLSVVGTLLSSSIAAYAFSRMRFPGRGVLFAVLLGSMMLPGAVTLLPQFLIVRWLGWVDTLYPLWVPAFFGAAFNIFLLRQFFLTIPMELEDAAKIDGCSYFRTFWDVMLPQIKPALAVIAIWTFLASWNNFMGPLIYINSPENMPVSYALQLYQSDRGAEPGLLMAIATMAMMPVLLLFFFAQRYFIEGVALTGLGGR